jgi:hypothetical protein
MNAEELSPEDLDDQREDPSTPAAQATAPEPASDDDQGIGARVTAVFTAAEKAGQHIVTLAREEADDIRREARAEAEAYLREQRLEADKEVQKIFADARKKADVIEAEARSRAQQVEDDARVRKDRLREEARLIEERIAWAKEGLVEVDERLQEVFLDSEPLAARSETGA